MYELMKNAFRRYEDEDLEDFLHAANEEHFFPPLSDTEMREVLENFGDSRVDCEGYIGMYCNRALCLSRFVGYGQWPKDGLY